LRKSIVFSVVLLLISLIIYSVSIIIPGNSFVKMIIGTLISGFLAHYNYDWIMYKYVYRLK
jgi:uncharacterized membrane-anchored protein